MSWHVLPDVTGHYAAHTNPTALAADIRGFFTRLRWLTAASGRRPAPRRL
jgi:hypothetical protein